MRPPADYRALRHITPEGSWAAAFNVGDDVTEDQRRNLRLVVGEDVTPLSDTVMHRPADDDDRAEWQDYAVVRGVPYDEARTLDRAELITRVGNPPDDSNGAVPLAPAASDRKAVWAEFAAHRIVLDSRGQVDLGAARTRANAASKDDLIAAFGPDGGDEQRTPFLAPTVAPQTSTGLILPPGESLAQAPTGSTADDAVPAGGNPQPDNTAQQAKAANRGRAARE
jgi:hypothetical protein